jgi:hypothetical protein
MTKQIAAMFVIGLLGGLVLLYGLISIGTFVANNWGARVSVEARG